MGIIFRNRKGFTFIEMIVVVGIIALVLPALFSIIYSILFQQARIMRLAEVKRQGDFALVTMEGVLRDSAVGIYSDETLASPVCTSAGSTYSSSGGNNIYIKNKDGDYVQFYTSTDKILTRTGLVPTAVELTTAKVKISDFVLSCDRQGAFSPPILTLRFKVEYNTLSSRPEETASLNYQTKVKLRSL